MNIDCFSFQWLHSAFSGYYSWADPGPAYLPPLAVKGPKLMELIIQLMIVLI